MPKKSTTHATPASFSSSGARNVTATIQERPAPPPKETLLPTKSSTNSNNPSKKVSSSKLALPPSLAAAMLSFPWPPPEKPMLALALQNEKDARAPNEPQEDITSSKASVTSTTQKDEPKGGCCCGTKNPQPCCSRKLYPKKKSQCPVPLPPKSVLITGDHRTRKPGQPYLPVQTPPFKHVHTAWPGFDHAPVPNWKRKYMIAKPWPYHQNQMQNQRRLQQQRLASPMTSPELLLSRPSGRLDLQNDNLYFTGRSVASLSSNESQTQVVDNRDVNGNSSGGPRGPRSEGQGRICQDNNARGKGIHVQRVGSCMR